MQLRLRLQICGTSTLQRTASLQAASDQDAGWSTDLQRSPRESIHDEPGTVCHIWVKDDVQQRVANLPKQHINLCMFSLVLG
jgi:hypothetical protein